MHRINWDDLRFVLAVADAGSVAAAARNLRVNHATVLRRIAQFEDTHEVEVFEKAATGYTVSTAARNIVEAIREANHAVFAVERLARDGSRALQGDVRVTSTDTLSALILPDVARQISRVERDLRIEILSSNAHTDLSGSIADIAVRPTEVLPPDMFGRQVGHLRFAVYRRGDGQAEGWLGLRGNLSRSRPALWMASNVNERDVLAAADSFMTLRELAITGRGQSYLPTFVGDASADLVRVEDAGPEMSVKLWVASHKSLTSTARISRMRDLLAEFLEQTPAFQSAT